MESSDISTLIFKLYQNSNIVKLELEFDESPINGELLLSITAEDTFEDKLPISIYLQYLSEKQILEFFFYLKANLAKKYANVL